MGSIRDRAQAARPPLAALPRRGYAWGVDEHTLRVLEFDKVIALVATECAFSVGRELVGAIRPEVDYSAAVERQAATAEMRALDQMGLDIPFAGAKDIRPQIRAAAIGQALDPGDLLDAAQVLKTAARARNVVERVRARAPRLGGVVDDVAGFHRFVDEVETAITTRGEVADAASDALATARRELRAAQDRLEQRAQAALADAVRRGIAQEGLLTERNGRKVIPIKAEQRGQLPGIVHDVSSSGATVFVEPLSVVEAGNQVRELQVAVEREIRRVLERLTALLGEREDAAAATLMALGRLDMLCALVAFGRKMKAQLPPPADVEGWLRPSGATVVVRARHPLLRGDVVPIDIDVGGDSPGLLITGPNTGGKTVALKTLGLLTLMAQAGIPVPCDEGSRFTVYPQVFADIGDEQSIEQSLSTFSSHMRNVTAILREAAPGTLVLLDELGAGTDPTEGSALARAIVETLLERGCTLVATTHHSELKAFAAADPRLRNASVEFDVETLSPSYHLTIGLPGQSNAIAIARRLGLDEPVLQRAAAQLSPQHFELEQMLAAIRDERGAAGEARERQELAQAEAEALRLALAERSDRIEDERSAILEAALRQGEDAVAEVRHELDEVRRRVARRELDPAAADETLRRLDAHLATVAASARRRRQPVEGRTALRAVVPGDSIHVRDIPYPGEALSAEGEDGRVEVQFGSLRMKVSVDRIDRVDGPAVSRGTAAVTVPAEPRVEIELDLRGQRAEEALLRFETYLDEAFRAGLPFVRIIHGKGTGALRAAIREALSGHPLVRRFETAAAGDGGEGVTVAVMAG